MDSHEKEMRDRRLTFYKDDIDAMKAAAQELLDESKSRCAVLVDKEGHMVTQVGEADAFDPETISALVAGNFAATKEIARLLGEDEFSVLYHQGDEDSIQLSIVGDRMLLAIVFDEQTTLGLVRLCADRAVKKLLDIVEAREAAGNTGDEDLDDDFGSEAEGKLDDVFGEGS